MFDIFLMFSYVLDLWEAGTSLVVCNSHLFLRECLHPHCTLLTSVLKGMYQTVQFNSMEYVAF